MGISIRLKELRKSRGYTQESMAKALGVPLGTYRNWEQGIHEPDNDRIIEIVKILDTSSDYLFGRTNFSNNPTTAEVTAQSLKDDEKVLLSTWRELRNGDKEFIRRQMELLKKERDQQRGDN